MLGLHTGRRLQMLWRLSPLLAVITAAFLEERVADAPYIFLTGFSRHELEELSYLPGSELSKRIGLREVPGGFSGERSSGRAAHAIASYLGTLRWGPDVTLACGYLREYVPVILHRKQADPADIAANYAGVAYALKEKGVHH